MNQPPLGPSPSRLRWASLAFVLLGGCALAVDLPLARWFEADSLSGSIVKFFKLAEVFGHGLGVGMILLTVWVLDPRNRPRLLQAGAMAFGSGFAANLIKICAARSRPHDTDLANLNLTIGDTFLGWLPLFKSPATSQSLPSSHTATAVGLAIALTWLYPHGRKLFWLLAALAAGQRLVTGAHFLSDVFWGAAVGCVFVSLLVPASQLNRLFDRWEARRSRPETAGLRKNDGEVDARLQCADTPVSSSPQNSSKAA